jgi:hypothetical protein
VARTVIHPALLDSRLAVPKVKLVFVSVYGFVSEPAVSSLLVRALEAGIVPRLERDPTRLWVSSLLM